MSYLKIIRKILSDSWDLPRLNSLTSLTSQPEYFSGCEESEYSEESPYLTKPAQVRIPAPKVTLEDLGDDLRHWPGNPRCAEVELERAGIARQEAMRLVRERYEYPEQGGDHA